MSRASPHHFQLERSKTVHEKGMAVADPDLKLRVGGRGRFGLLTLPAFLPSVISSIFIQNRGTVPPYPPTPVLIICIVKNYNKKNISTYILAV